VEKIGRAKKARSWFADSWFVVQTKIRNGGFREQGAGEEIFQQKGDSNRRLEKLHKKEFHNFKLHSNLLIPTDLSLLHIEG
jgi:hypothetical protein